MYTSMQGTRQMQNTLLFTPLSLGSANGGGEGSLASFTSENNGFEVEVVYVSPNIVIHEWKVVPRPPTGVGMCCPTVYAQGERAKRMRVSKTALEILLVRKDEHSCTVLPRKLEKEFPKKPTEQQHARSLEPNCRQIQVDNAECVQVRKNNIDRRGAKSIGIRADERIQD
ncbi:hypothetical protein BDV93DRAFT_509910 [Ceratobasidium sp. AG-I]|nr:hypothetical protein BDV93DRAFT_509910 [Ceratobasidium sp. AG-I]